MHRTMLPTPPTSTAFSCQLSKTPMAAVTPSLAPIGLLLIWLNPVDCGVIFVVGPLEAAPTPMPLYLTAAFAIAIAIAFAISKESDKIIQQNAQVSDNNIDVQILHQHV